MLICSLSDEIHIITQLLLPQRARRDDWVYVVNVILVCRAGSSYTVIPMGLHGYHVNSLKPSL